MEIEVYDIEELDSGKEIVFFKKNGVSEKCTKINQFNTGLSCIDNNTMNRAYSKYKRLANAPVINMPKPRDKVRDTFAIEAMKEILKSALTDDPDKVAEQAFAIADAMIERGK